MWCKQGWLTLRLLCLTVWVTRRSLVHWISLGSSVSARSVPNFCNSWAVVFTVTAKFSMAWGRTPLWVHQHWSSSGSRQHSNSPYGGVSTGCGSNPGFLPALQSAALCPHTHEGLTESSASQSVKTVDSSYTPHFPHGWSETSSLWASASQSEMLPLYVYRGGNLQSLIELLMSLSRN